jgi:hypothetical protein
MSYRTIDNIVRSYKADKGQNSLHGYVRILKWAIDGLRDWHFDGGLELKTVCIKINPNLTADLPKDYEIWTKVGLSKGDRIMAFVPDSTIKMNNTYEDKPNDKYFTHTFSNYTDPSGSTGEIRGYGYGHNGVGYFRMDKNCIRFSSEITAEFVYLEYLSNGFDPSTETLVNEHAYKIILEYIRWQEGRHKYGDASAEAQYRKQEYLNEIDKSMKRTSDLSYEGIQDIIARSTTLTV